MAMTTTTLTISEPGWQKIVDGSAPVEMLAEADWNGRYAFGASAPAAGVVGYLVTANVPFVIPATVGGSSVWFMPTSPRTATPGTLSPCRVTLTPAE